MKKKYPFTLLAIGIILIAVGTTLPKNTDSNYNIIILVVGAIVLMVSLVLFIKSKMENK